MTVQGNGECEPHVFIGSQIMENLVPKSTVITKLAVSFFTEYIMRPKKCEFLNDFDFTFFFDYPVPKIDILETKFLVRCDKEF